MEGWIGLKLSWTLPDFEVSGFFLSVLRVWPGSIVEEFVMVFSVCLVLSPRQILNLIYYQPAATTLCPLGSGCSETESLSGMICLARSSKPNPCPVTKPVLIDGVSVNFHGYLRNFIVLWPLVGVCSG
jgi:hypothetical protein